MNRIDRLMGIITHLQAKKHLILSRFSHFTNSKHESDTSKIQKKRTFGIESVFATNSKRNFRKSATSTDIRLSVSLLFFV
jgi:hypothetical protein